MQSFNYNAWSIETRPAYGWNTHIAGDPLSAIDRPAEIIAIGEDSSNRAPHLPRVVSAPSMVESFLIAGDVEPAATRKGCCPRRGETFSCATRNTAGDTSICMSPS
jgi:hypothetical protein